MHSFEPRCLPIDQNRGRACKVCRGISNAWKRAPLLSLDSYGMIGIEIYHKELTIMPRPKGSKNKKAFEQVESIETIDERIAAAETAIASLSEELKAKKAELKRYQKMKEDAERIAAEKKAEEDKAAILAAVEASGKSVEEILELLK